MEWPTYKNGIPVGLIMTVAAGIFIGSGLSRTSNETRGYVHETKPVQQGYMTPSELEGQCSNESSALEATLRTGDKPALPDYAMKPIE